MRALVPPPARHALEPEAAAAGARRRLRPRRPCIAELDELRTLRDQSRRHIAALEERYRGETGDRLAQDPPQQPARLLHRGDLPRTRRKVPPGFVQRQGMAGAIRYSTAELAELESRIAGGGRARAGAGARAVRGAAPGGAGEARGDRRHGRGPGRARRRGGARDAGRRAALRPARWSTTATPS